MELVPGETLAERIKVGAIPVSDALNIAIQVAQVSDHQGWWQPSRVVARRQGTDFHERYDQRPTVFRRH